MEPDVVNEAAISEAIRTTREELGISHDELAEMTGLSLRMVKLLETNCTRVPLGDFIMVVDALELQMAFQKPLDEADVAAIDALNVREYTTADDFNSAQEWAQLAYRMAIADAAMSADLGGLYQ